MVAVINNSGAPQVGDVWIDVTLPSGTVYGPLVLRSHLNMAVGFNTSRQLTQAVPTSAPAGTYTMNAYVGEYDINQPWTEDHFDFSKSGVVGEAIGYLPEIEGFDLTGSETDLAALPDEIQLTAYPNPFNPTTTLSFTLPSPARVSLSVYDVSGRLVTTLMNGWRDAGSHQVTFDGSGLVSGVYIYRLQAADFSASGKMVLMK